MPIDNNTLNFLNLKVSDIEEISTSSSEDTIFFNVTLSRKNHNCPNCNNVTNKIKDYKTKLINHALFNDGRQSYISYNQRRYLCTVCNKSFIEQNPFCNKNDKLRKDYYKKLTF